MSRLALVTLLGVIACGPPQLTSLDPAEGPERTLVNVNGDVGFSGVVWDAGAGTETQIPGGFLGAYFFSVPPAAPLGPHDVALRRGGQTGNSLPFNVTAALPFGAPRLDRVSVAGTQFRAGNKVVVWLYAQGANIDVGAEVLVDGIVQPTVAHRGLRNDLFDVDPTTLDYPIYHYVSLLAAPGERDTGAVIQVKVRNRNGEESNTVDYTLPADAATLDSDGDDIPDAWELNGYDADGDGVIDIDLPGLGASVYRPDMLLEVDIMSGLTNVPDSTVFQAMQAAYAAAPIINPVGDNGVNLIIDFSGTVPFSQTLDLEGADDPGNGFANFYTLKGANFDNTNRGRLYHYCIWGNARPNGTSGVSDANLSGNVPGDDCIVSFDDFSAATQTVRSMASTLMHEVGHNLNQRHGGANHFQYNPAYSSVMSYNWQLRTGLSAATRRARPVCVPFYYADATAVEVNGALPGAISNVIDYSEGMVRTLNEAALNETTGVCNNVAADWNNDGDAVDNPVAVDRDGDGAADDLLSDFPNWARLLFAGPRLNGRFGA
jgi:hypothetical protein